MYKVKVIHLHTTPTYIFYLVENIIYYHPACFLFIKVTKYVIAFTPSLITLCRHIVPEKGEDRPQYKIMVTTIITMTPPQYYPGLCDINRKINYNTNCPI